LQSVLIARLFGAQLRAVPFRDGLLHMQLLDTLTLGGNDEFGFTHARAQGIPLRQLRVHPMGEFRDSGAHRGQLGFRLRRILGLGGGPGTARAART
jgi:hypothetical protein